MNPPIVSCVSKVGGTLSARVSSRFSAAQSEYASVWVIAAIEQLAISVRALSTHHIVIRSIQKQEHHMNIKTSKSSINLRGMRQRIVPAAFWKDFLCADLRCSSTTDLEGAWIWETGVLGLVGYVVVLTAT